MKGLEQLLEKIQQFPQKKILKIRFLAMVGDLADPAEKAVWCLKLSRLYSETDPKQALQLAYVACKYDPESLEAGAVISDSLTKMGKHEQSESMRECISATQNNKADNRQQKHILNNLPVFEAFTPDNQFVNSAQCGDSKAITIDETKTPFDQYKADLHVTEGDDFMLPISENQTEESLLANITMEKLEKEKPCDSENESFEDNFEGLPIDGDGQSRIDYAHYDNELLSQIFDYYYEKNNLTKAKEIVESAASHSASQAWWKAAFGKLVGKGGEHENNQTSRSSSQSELDRLLKLYDQIEGEHPWLGLADCIDLSQAKSLFDAFEKDKSCLEITEYFLLFLDLAIYVGYSQVVLSEVSAIKPKLLDKEVKKAVFLRWRRANQLLKLQVDLSNFLSETVCTSSNDCQLAEAVSNLSDYQFRELISTRMQPTHENLI